MGKLEVVRIDPHERRSAAGAGSGNLIIPARNLLIGSLPHEAANDLTDAARAVQLKLREVIYEGGDEIAFAYFPIDCVVSSAALLEDGSTVEIAMTGREGLVGIPALIGGGRSLHWTRVSIGGKALKISIRALEEQAKRHEALHRVILKSYRSLFTQICQRSVCNVRHTLLQRLCVWLLMVHDRVGRDELPLTQEEIAARISVRRAGVSVAAAMLQSMHGIATRRGKIVILDRGTLETTACECYALLRKDFENSGGGKQP